ncbi:hypothetical protein BHM03_00054570 [Ensete ventricosum]|uniref:Uncharacterized protein n=1 Tax=Ensete ventricosum TaxID=4639 RepID=A0A445MM50_ENSVE|nr:hypothetical protein BHM03_00054570 [Ensete ventricosum]
MIGCRGWDWFELDRKSNFVIELARQSGRLRELLRLGVVAAPPQVGSPGSGPQATPFAEMPSGEVRARVKGKVSARVDR